MKYRNNLLKWLHANPEFINKPNRTKGRTILHSLQPDIMKELNMGGKEKEAHDEFPKLYVKGGQCDLMDHKSKLLYLVGKRKVYIRQPKTPTVQLLHTKET